MNAKEYLESKGVFGLDTKKRYNEIIGWMEEYAQEVVKNCSIHDVSGRSEQCNHKFERVEKGGEFQGNQCDCGEWENLT